MTGDENDTPPSPTPTLPPDLPPTEKKRGRPSGSSKAASEDAAIIDGLTKIYGLVGIIAFNFNTYDGTAIIENSAAMAGSLVAVSHRNKEFHRVLAMISSGNDIGAVIAVHASVLIAIMANHRMVPSSMAVAMGMPRPPEPPPEETPSVTRGGGAVTPMFDRGPSSAPPEPGHSETAVDAPRVELGGLTEAQYNAMVAAAIEQAAIAQAADGTPKPEHNPAAIGGLVNRRG